MRLISRETRLFGRWREMGRRMVPAKVVQAKVVQAKDA